MKYYITKYAMTHGIQEIDSEQDKVEENNGYLYFVPRSGARSIQVRKMDWFRTLPEAQTRFEALRTAKLRSLRKSAEAIKRLSDSPRPWE